MQLPISDWHCSRIRVIGNVVDSVTEPRKNNYKYFLKWNTKNKNLFIILNGVLLVIQTAAFKAINSGCGPKSKTKIMINLVLDPEYISIDFGIKIKKTFLNVDNY